MNKVIIQSQLSLEDYINVNYALLFRKAGTKFIFAIALFLIAGPFVLYGLDAAPYISWEQSAIGVALIAFLLFTVNFSARKNYNTNKRISEQVTYDFSDDRLIITAETSNANIPWDKIYKVTQTKNFLLIWQSSLLANIIPKRNTTPADLAIIKSIVQQNKVKNNLK